MKIAILGAGAWGTALALQASARHAVTLWGRSAAHVSLMQEQHVNSKYLDGIAIPSSLTLTAAKPSQEWLAFDVIIIATPTAALRSMLTTLSHLKIKAPVVWLCKGFEAFSPQSDALSDLGGMLPHELAQRVAPDLMVGALSGPSFAQEVARLQPTALVAASLHPSVRSTLVQAFHTETLRIYGNDDIVGVEVGGAVKNVMAIATGLCDGLGLGLNARAALITRGLSEMTALGVALGARAQTFMGLSGLGDLVLTTTGDLSRNRQVGLCLSKGMGLQETLASLGHVAEGVYSAHTVVQRALALGVEMPIAQAVVALLGGRLQPSEALALLMRRSARDESHGS